MQLKIPVASKVLRVAILKLTKYCSRKKINFYKAVVNVAGCAECFEKIGQSPL